MSFDAATDPAVRVEANPPRRVLTSWYGGGIDRRQPLWTVPMPGGYRPRFEPAVAALAAEAVAASSGSAAGA